MLLPEGLPSGLLLEAPEVLEEADSEGLADSSEGMEEDVVDEASSDVCEDVEAKSEAADSEAADSAGDIPSLSSGFHMKAPTYACALAICKATPCSVQTSTCYDALWRMA